MAVLVVHYIGVFSAATAALALGLYFFAGSQHRRVGLFSYGTLVLLYLASSVVTAAGLVPDTSLFPAGGAAPSTRWFQVVMSQVIFGITFYLARRNRGAMERALERVRRVSMQIRQRDAQLAEARRELDRALHSGEGRHSGSDIGGYRLGPVLGRGGMGEVYRGVPAGGDDQSAMAIKVLHPNLLESESHVRRFLREAQIASAVRSPHIVELREHGRTPEGAPYLVMELLDGHDLGWHLRRSGRLPLGAVTELVDHTAVALVAMREAGIVHRDLKPANLIRTDTIPHQWKVLDFGLSKMLGREGSALTQGDVVGTPQYMAPEQIDGTVDARTDLYGVAALAYRALTGSPPFDGDKPIEIAHKVLHLQPADPARFVRMPRDVELALAIGLAKRPEDRFQRIEDFANALRDAARGAMEPSLRLQGARILRKAPWGASWQPSDARTNPIRKQAMSDFEEGEETIAD